MDWPIGFGRSGISNHLFEDSSVYYLLIKVYIIMYV